MLLEWVPIENFLTEKYRGKSVQEVVGAWNVDPDQVVDILVRFFREMGIYRVSHINAEVVVTAMMHHLRTSPDVHALVKKVNREEQQRRSRSAG